MTMREYEKVCQMISNINGFVIDGKYFLDGVPDVPNSKMRLAGALEELRNLKWFMKFVTISDEHKYQIEDEQKSEKEEENESQDNS